MTGFSLTESALRCLHGITSDQTLDFEAKLRAVLDMGTAQFGLPIGILARIEGDDYHVESVNHGAGSIEIGMVFPLADTYCERTLKADGPIGFIRAEGSEWVRHPAYRKFRLEAYFGIPVTVEGKVYGTLNFSGPEPRGEPFSDAEYEILGLMAQWVSGELTETQPLIDSISRRSRTIAELERKKAEFEAMFDSIPDAVIFADVNRRIQMVNPAVEKIFGYSPDELIGETTELLYSESSDYEAQGIMRFNPQASPDVLPYDMCYRRKSGDTFIGETCGVPVRDYDGETIGLAGVIRDITDRKADEAKVRQAREHFQALYDASPDMLFLHAADGTILDVNENALRTYGYSREEMLSRSVADLSGGDWTGKMAADRVARALAGEPMDFAWTCKVRDGRELPVEVRLRRLPPSSGPMDAALVAVVRDLSGIRSAERILQQERDFSNAVLDTIGSLVVVMNRDGDIVRFNQAAQALSGYSEPEALGRRVWDFLLLPEEKPGVGDEFSRLTTGDFPSQYENHWLARDGESRLIQWSNSALADRDGKVEFVIATGIDITDRRRAEQGLEQVEMEWNQAIEFFTEPMYLVDLEDRVVRANQAFIKLLGKTPQQVIGKNIMNLMHPRGEGDHCPVCAARRERRDADIVVEEDDQDNAVGRPFEAIIRVIRDRRNEPVGILMGIRDLTRQRQIEAELRDHRDHLEDMVRQRTAALEAANSELESFSYSVSHDLRAPLRSIDGFSHALLEDYTDSLDETGRGYLRRVRKASQRMGILIDDLLQLSRIGRDAMEHMEVDLSRMARGVLKALQENDPDRNVVVEVQEGLRATGDPRLLRLLLENLLGNAWKYTGIREVGEIRIGMQSETAAQKTFFVRDNGVGFDMKYSDKLFGAFQRLHSDVEFAGTGIGLATVHKIVSRHEGKVWGEAILDQGATFWFSLPA